MPEPGERPLGTERPRPSAVKPAANASSSTQTRHTYQLVYVPNGCVGYSTGNRVEVFVDEPPPDWIPIDLGPGCSDCVGVLDD